MTSRTRRRLAAGLGILVTAAWLGARPAEAQQRPLVTEDPEVIGPGLILFEGGVEIGQDVVLTLPGLRGDLLEAPTFGLSFGLGEIAELQIDGRVSRLDVVSRQEPLDPLGFPDPGASTRSFGDLVIATKIRMRSETEGVPAVGIRFATKVPTASRSSGLGAGTTDLFASLLFGKTIQSVRVVGNLGLGVVGNPIVAGEHRNVGTFGLSLARALTEALEVVGEVSGRASQRSGDPIPGAENRGRLQIGTRFTRGAFRFDAAFLTGLTTRDPSWGATFGLTYVRRVVTP